MDESVWKRVPDHQMVKRHYTIELGSSFKDSPLLIICSNDEAMKAGSRVVIGARANIQTDRCAADIYTSHWRFAADPKASLHDPAGINGGLNLINKKSGLPLSDGKKQGGPWIDLYVDLEEGGRQTLHGVGGDRDRFIVAERYRLDTTTNEYVGTNEFCFLRPPEEQFDPATGAISPDARLALLTAIKAQRVFPHRQLEWSSKHSITVSDDGRIKGDAIAEAGIFRLVPATWDFDRGRQALDLPKADVQKQLAGIWLGAIGVGVTNLGCSMQGGVASVAMLGPASAAPLAIGGIVSIIQAALATSDLLDEQGKKSDLEVLYDALVPEIRQIVQEEFDRAELRDAMAALDQARGAFLDAVLMYGGWCKKAGILDGDFALIAPAQDIGLGPVLAAGSGAGFDAMSDADREQIGRTFQDAHAKFGEGLNRLRLNRNARLTLGPFGTGALAHIGLLFNLSLLSYDLWHGVLLHALRTYRDHIKNTFEEIRSRRFSKFEVPGIAAADTYYGGSKSPCVCDEDMFLIAKKGSDELRSIEFSDWHDMLMKYKKTGMEMIRESASYMLNHIRPSKNNYFRHVESTLEIDFLQPLAIADRLDSYLRCLESMNDLVVNPGLLAEIADTTNWAPVGGKVPVT